MKFDRADLEIGLLDGESFDEILALAEVVEEAPRWSRAQYENFLSAGDVLPDQISRRRIALVARETGSGQVAGFVIASLVAPEAELESIAVAENARRHGVGRRLVESLVTRLRTQGITHLHLEARVSNTAAIGFYRAQDFKQSGVRPRYYTDPEEDAILMTLRLE